MSREAAFDVHTPKAYGALDVTADLARAVAGWPDGAILVWLEHTTAGLVLGPADDGQMRDYARFAEHAFEDLGPFEHQHVDADIRNGREHLLSTVVGTRLLLQIRDADLVLGRWQRVLLLEFDGPKERHVHVATFEAGDGRQSAAPLRDS